jgi:hypothetical protein
MDFNNSSKGSPYLTLFQETSLNFLKSLKPLLFYVEKVLLRVCWDQWFEIRLQLPELRNIWYYMDYCETQGNTRTKPWKNRAGLERIY